MSRFDRRNLIKAGAAGASLALFQARGSAQTPVASPVTGWSFTDDRGITVTADAAPTRVIAQTTSAATLWDFGFEVVGFYGPNDPGNEVGFPAVGSMNVDGLAYLGDYGTPNLEAVVQSAPQLYVDLLRGAETLWYLSAEEEALLSQICPTVGINAAAVPQRTITQRYEELAISLGVDPSGEILVTAKAQYEEAERAFAEVAATIPDVKVLTVSPGDSGTVYIWNPNWLPDLMLMTEFGMTAVDPQIDPALPSVQVSIEQAGEYEADVILLDIRAGLAAVEGNPVWESLPAVQAGQVGYWYASFPNSYQKVAEVLDLTRETLTGTSVII